MCYTENAPNAWHRRRTQKTGNTYNQPNRPSTDTTHRPSTKQYRKGSPAVKTHNTHQHSNHPLSVSVSSAGSMSSCHVVRVHSFAATLQRLIRTLAQYYWGMSSPELYQNRHKNRACTYAHTAHVLLWQLEAPCGAMKNTADVGSPAAHAIHRCTVLCYTEKATKARHRQERQKHQSTAQSKPPLSCVIVRLTQGKAGRKACHTRGNTQWQEQSTSAIPAATLLAVTTCTSSSE